MTLRLTALFAFVSLTAFADPSPLARYRAAASSLGDANAAVAEAQKAFSSCSNGRLQLVFAPSLPSIEQARRSFEKRRREAERSRQSLEAARQRMEAARAKRHSTVAEREASEAHYAAQIVSDYETPMAEVAAAVEDYRAGMLEYAAVMKEYGAFCGTAGITDASARTFVSGLTPKIDAMVKHAQESRDRATTQTPARDVSQR